MAPAERIPADERRERILGASIELFARHGLHGVTTRMIAEAAGISEALLYRHFRGKDELYEELQRWCLRDTRAAADRLSQLEPTTATLVLAVYFTVRQILQAAEGSHRAVCIRRLILASLIDDGEFARGFVEKNFGRYLPKLVDCLDAARRAGDLVDRGRTPELRIWLVHHLAVQIGNMRLPERAVVDYGVSHEVLVEETTRFALRGLGLTEDAIGRHFAPKTLAAFTSRLLQETQQDPVPESKQTSTHKARPAAGGVRR